MNKLNIENNNLYQKCVNKKDEMQSMKDNDTLNVKTKTKN